MAEIVTLVCVATAVVVIVKEGETVVPAATVTDGGTLATVGSLLDSVTTAPADGASPFNVTVLPVVDLPPTTVFGDSVTAVSTAGLTERVAVFWLAPSLAVMVTLVTAATAVVVMVNCGDTVAPPATVTEGGTAATAGSELVSVMVAPLVGAAAASVTVLAVVELPPRTEAGERVTLASATRTLVRAKSVAGGPDAVATTL